MEQTISKLLETYESGKVTRRQVVAALTALVAGGAKVSGAGISGGALDHLSIQVGDLERSTKFYSDVLGLTVATGSRPDGSVRLNLPKGGYLTIRKFNPPGKIDHFGIKLEDFNKEAVTQQLKSKGIIPIDEPNFSRTPDNPNGGAGFHVVDPDGVNVQLLKMSAAQYPNGADASDGPCHHFAAKAGSFGALDVNMTRSSRFRKIILALTLAGVISALPGSLSGQESPEQAFLTAKYSLVTTVERIPPAVLTDLLARMKHDARLANPGERFNSTDVIDTRYPRRRLVLAGIESRSWFVSYEHGGRGYHRHLVVFTKSGDRMKLAYARTFLSRATTLEELRQLVKTGQIREGEEF